MSAPVTVADPNAAPRISPLIQLREFWYYFSVNRGAVIGLVVFVLLVLTAIFANWLAPHSPIQQYRDALLVPRLPRVHRELQGDRGRLGHPLLP